MRNSILDIWLLAAGCWLLEWSPDVSDLLDGSAVLLPDVDIHKDILYDSLFQPSQIWNPCKILIMIQ